MLNHPLDRFDAVGNRLQIGSCVTFGWRDSRRPKERGHVVALASRATINTPTHHGLVMDYRDILLNSGEPRP